MKDWLDLLKSPLKEVIIFALVVVVAIGLSHIIHYILKRININRFLNKGSLRKIKSPLAFIFVTILSKPAIQYLNIHFYWLDNILYLLLIFSSAWLLVQVVAIIRSVLLNQFDIESHDNLQARKVFTQVRVFERIVIVMIVVLSIGLALMTFDGIRQVGISLLTSAGIAGIIVGLAAQKLIGNILAGLQIAITQPIRIDDVVVVENEWGRIEEITLTYVVVNIWDKRRLVVPSTYFIQQPFQNWTRTTSELLATVFIYTDYRMPVDPLRAELTRILHDTELWDRQVNVIQVTDAREHTIELRALMSAKDSPTAWDLRVHVREKLIGFLQKNYPDMLPKTRVELAGEK